MHACATIDVKNNYHNSKSCTYTFTCIIGRHEVVVFAIGLGAIGVLFHDCIAFLFVCICLRLVLTTVGLADRP